MSVVTKYEFTVPENYTFDASILEIAAGKAKLKNIINPNETAFNDFATKDLLRSAGGILTGNLAGLAALTDGKLVLQGGIASWNFNPTGMHGADANITTIRFKYTPNYNGMPANNTKIMTEQKASNDTSNLIEINHNASGFFSVTLRDQAGIAQNTHVVDAALSLNIGQEYEFEYVMNTTTGSQQFYIDGVPTGPESTEVYTRDKDNIAYVMFGSTTANSNFSIDDYQKFDNVQHNADFSSEIPRVVPLTPFVLTSPSIEVNTGLTLDSLLAFVETVIKTGDDNVKYILRFNGLLKYHNGANWVNSNGTIAQSNSAEEINTNALSLDLSSGGNLKVLALLTSDDGSTTPEVDELSLTSNFFNVSQSLSKCIVYGEVLDHCGNPVVGATICVDGSDHYNGTALLAKPCCTTTDDDGKWELEVVETVSTSETVNFTTKYLDNEGDEITKTDANIIIPDQQTCALSDLI